MARVILSGALANKPRNGGGAWERMSWAVGLRRLGFDVWFVEQIAPAGFAVEANRNWFRTVTRRFGFAERSALVCGERSEGIAWPRLLEVAGAAELLVNLG